MYPLARRKEELAQRLDPADAGESERIEGNRVGKYAVSEEFFIYNKIYDNPVSDCPSAKCPDLCVVQ